MNSNNNTCSTISTQTSPLQLAKGLSKSQLLDLLGNLVVDSPDLIDKLSEVLPKPDISGLVSNLISLNRNVYKALPANCLSNSKDSLTYKRVATHLAVFKKSLVGDLVMLQEAGQWDGVVDYILLVWDIVRSLPVWENPVHNTTRDACFKYMASTVIKIRKQKNEAFDEMKRKQLVELMAGSSIREVQYCQKMLLELSEEKHRH